MKSCLGHGPPRESIQVWMPPLSYNIVLIVESRLSYPIIKLVAIILACSACLITECRVPVGLLGVARGIRSSKALP